jgi:hypothetical protein
MSLTAAPVITLETFTFSEAFSGESQMRALTCVCLPCLQQSMTPVEAQTLAVK